MSLQSKIEAVIYASEEPVTLQQLVVLLSEEVQAELHALAARQAELPLGDAGQGALPVGGSVQDEKLAGDPDGADAVASEAVSGAGAATTGDVAPQSDVAAAGATAPSEAEAEASEEDATAPGEADAETPQPESQHTPEDEKRLTRERERAVREYLREVVDRLMREYADADRGLEIREVAGGFRFGTKPEYHDAVRGFVKSLKPVLKLSLQALETLAVVAYKQPVTAAEISEIRGVDSAGVLGGLLTRKLIMTAGRKQVIGRPMLYKTSKEFLVRFGLKDIQELPSMEEFERMAGELAEQEDLPMEATASIIERANARGDAEHILKTNGEGGGGPEASPAEEAGAEPASTIEEDMRDSAPEPEADSSAGEGDSSALNEVQPPATNSEEQEAK